jgi:pyridinium-3,5-bisthiocarboxylic acid mononucleotide nickel chelatase
MNCETGYFEVYNGCAGDMLAGSLIDAGLDIEELKENLKKIPLSCYEIEVEKVEKETAFSHPLTATQFLVKPLKEEWDDHTSYKKIVKILNSSGLVPKQKKKIKDIFKILGTAEAKVHGESLEKVHFHQVGQIDAIVEIASVVIGLDLMKIEKVYCSSIGISEPAPATAELLKGLPVCFKTTPCETVTPTGISILKGVCDFTTFNRDMILKNNGYGAGQRNIPKPNVVQFLTGTTSIQENEVVVIETNMDDFNPLLFENLFNKLFRQGALDVSVFTGLGKKNRPVFNLQVIIPTDRLTAAAEILFKETTTIGFRFRREARMILERNFKEVKTSWGTVRVKTASSGKKIFNALPEYDDCKKIAEKFDVPLKKVYAEIEKKLEI